MSKSMEYYQHSQSKRSGSMGEAIAYDMAFIFGGLVRKAITLPFKYYITFLWLLPMLLIRNNATFTTIWLFLVVCAFLWKPLSKKFGFFYWEPMDKFLPIVSDRRRIKNGQTAIQRQMEARGVFVAAGIIAPDDEQTMLPAQFEQIGDGYSLVVDRPVTRSLQNDIEVLTSTNVAEYMGVSYIYPYVNNGRLVLDFVADADVDMMEGNRLLRQSGLIRDKDARFYLVSLDTTNIDGPQFVVVDEYIGNAAPIEVAERIGKNYMTRFNALYTETLTVGEEYASEFAKSFAKNWDITPEQVNNGSILRFVTNLDRDKEEANALLRQMALLRDGQYVDAILIDGEDEDKLVLRETIPGRNINAIANIAEGYKGILGARAVRAMKDADGNDVLRFIKQNKLDEPKIVEYGPGHMPEFNVDKMSVVCAVDEFGEKQSISFKDNSGMVIGGMPGSGKTAGATSFLLPVAMSPYVDLTIIDCKGGADWDSYKQVSSTFVSGADTADELEYIAEIFQDAEAEMIRRVNCQKELLGQSNFWNATVEQRQKAGLPFKLIVVDECQDLFEKKPDKELNAILPTILSSATKLIKRGRSAGIFVMFMTQKPTQDSLPTAIRDNCGLSIAFRLKSPYAVGAVLGPEAAADLGTSSPLNIPITRKGGAVIMTETGEFKEVRFFYTPEQNQNELLSHSEKALMLAEQRANPAPVEPDPNQLMVKQVELPTFPPGFEPEGDDEDSFDFSDGEEDFTGDDLFNTDTETDDFNDDTEDDLIVDKVDDVDEIEEEEPVEVTPVKRPVGRPRKNPEEKIDLSKPKRGRGRPRKNPITEEKPVVEEPVVDEVVETTPLKVVEEPVSDVVDTAVEEPQGESLEAENVLEEVSDNTENTGSTAAKFDNSKNVDDLFAELMKKL